MKKQVTRANAPGNSARLSSRHPLVGTWEQAPSAGATTTVVYTISVNQGQFRVNGKDGENGIALEISLTKWDGHSLRFTSYFPPTKHKAKHVLTVLSEGRMSHKISGTYWDGERFSDREIWRRRNKRLASKYS
jgi:hypothetical protein